MAKLTQLYEQKIFRIVGSNVGTVYFYILDLCVYFTCVYIYHMHPWDPGAYWIP